MDSKAKCQDCVTNELRTENADLQKRLDAVERIADARHAEAQNRLERCIDLKERAEAAEARATRAESWAKIWKRCAKHRHNLWLAESSTLWGYKEDYEDMRKRAEAAEARAELLERGEK
jgi:hypothetical protein